MTTLHDPFLPEYFSSTKVKKKVTIMLKAIHAPEDREGARLAPALQGHVPAGWLRQPCNAEQVVLNRKLRSLEKDFY